MATGTVTLRREGACDRDGQATVGDEFYSSSWFFLNCLTRGMRQAPPQKRMRAQAHQGQPSSRSSSSKIDDGGRWTGPDRSVLGG